MSKQPLPAAVLVVAILHFVGGGLSLLCVEAPGLATQAAGGASGIMKGFAGSGNPAMADIEKMEAFQKRELPHQGLFAIVSLSLGLVLSLVMIISGIGLLKLQPWGRTLSLIYAPCSILMRLAGTIYTLLFVSPVILRYYETEANFPPQMRAQMLMTQKITVYTSVLFGLVFIIYPIVVLFLLTRPGVVKAFADGGDADNEGYEESFRAR